MDKELQKALTKTGKSTPQGWGWAQTGSGDLAGPGETRTRLPGSWENTVLAIFLKSPYMSKMRFLREVLHPKHVDPHNGDVQAVAKTFLEPSKNWGNFCWVVKWHSDHITLICIIFTIITILIISGNILGYLTQGVDLLKNNFSRINIPLRNFFQEQQWKVCTEVQDLL